MPGVKRRKRTKTNGPAGSVETPNILGTSPPSKAANQFSTSSAAETCARCSDLGVHEAFAILDSGQDSPNISNVVMRRLVFDEPSSLQKDCTTCARLTKLLGSRSQIEPSRVSREDLSSAEIEEIKSKSSYSFQGNAVVRNTSKRDFDSFSKGTFNMSGEGFWEREVYRRRSQELKGETARLLGPEPDYDAIRAWMKHCNDHHERCIPTYSDSLASVRLIDVETMCLVSYPIDPTRATEYLVLSYVWGGFTQPSVTAGHDKLPEPLPRTIRDSITVTRALGMRYLWVDSICIDQSNSPEKKAQISIMDAIYLGASATIVALDGENADSGLPGVHASVPRQPQFVLEFSPGDEMVDVLPPLSDEVRVSRWARRAWTFQEGILSRRRILFTKHQVHYLCHEMACCETMNDATQFGEKGTRDVPAGKRRSRGSIDALEDPIFSRDDRSAVHIYNHMLNQYVSRAMSHDTDALNALLGLLQYIQRHRMAQGFHYGLPVKEFRSALLWQQSGETYLHDTYAMLSKSRRRIAAELPSWSFVAWRIQKEVRMLPWECEVSYIGFRPPLRIIDGQGRCLCDTLREFTRLRRLRQSTKPTKTYEASLALQDIYERVVENAAGKSNSSAGDTGDAKMLRIRGLVLSLPCTLSTSYGMFRPSKPVRHPCLAWPELGFDEDSYDENWYVDGQYRRFKPSSPDGGYQMHDLLLIETGFYYYEGSDDDRDLELDFLLVYKDGESYTREGVAKLRVTLEKAHILFREAKMTDILLG